MKTKIDLMNRLKLIMVYDKNPQFHILYKKVDESRNTKKVLKYRKILNAMIKGQKFKSEW